MLGNWIVNVSYTGGVPDVDNHAISTMIYQQSNHKIMITGWGVSMQVNLSKPYKVSYDLRVMNENWHFLIDQLLDQKWNLNTIRLKGHTAGTHIENINKLQSEI